MDKKIQEFVEKFIPPYLDNITKQNLINELTSHIYDKVDFYLESGFSESESLEKAFSAFAEKEETINKLREDFNKIYQPKSLADFFVNAIPVLIITVLLLYTIVCRNMLTLSVFVLFVIIPLVYLIFLKSIAISAFLKTKSKSIISVLLMISMIPVILSGYFITSDLKVTTYKNEKALEFADGMFCFNTDKPLTQPESCRLYYSEIIQFLDDEISTTLILKYNDEDYEKEIERIENCFIYKNNVFDGETAYNSTRFEAYDFNFFCVYDIPTDFEKEDIDAYYVKCWCFVGTNDKTKEIAYIEYDPYEFTPTFDSKFLKNKCGWQYFYYKHLIFS